MNRKEIQKRIDDNFSAMMETLECIINPFNPIKSMVITGASGIGKTYNLDLRLKEAHAAGDCNYHYLNSKCTAIGLYKAMYEARNLGSVLVLDDVDVFSNEDSLNLLKAALDTSNKRLISYQAASAELRKSNIPNQIEFSGKVIFITNSNLKAIAASTSNLAPHVNAVLTRSVFIDLEIHDNESIMIHIESIIRNTNIITKHGLSKDQANEILQFMLDNTDNLRNPSLRMPTQISGLVIENPTNWKRIAQKAFIN